MVKGTSRRMEAVSREYTVNLGKALHNISFKRRAPRAVKEIRKFVQKQMLTKEVKVDVKLNKAVWSKGIRYVPKRLRIVVQRKRKEDDEGIEDGEDMYCFVTLAEDQTTKGKGVVLLDA
ncbi:ribosomal protein L31e [Helicosporidium sp. ATCC 50920]|nr:ribosomal protein L31e [Helicosporidium sp. ATCC 50920]|eukprot:KDD76778.1 ribosomal protein L31e [Helicosporidium sp. ATCC 50920]